jgi:hypothetical protein
MLAIIELLKVSIEVLKKEVQEEYEQIIQGLEAEVRQHIRIEQQLKVYIGSVQEKVERYERLKEEVAALNEVCLTHV